MFCPKCRYEYVLGVIRCPDCGADLVYKLTPESSKGHNEPQQGGPNGEATLVIIFETFDASELAIAKSMLEEAGIEFMSNYHSDGSFWGHGARVIRVSSDDATRAHEILDDLKNSEPSDE